MSPLNASLFKSQLCSCKECDDGKHTRQCNLALMHKEICHLVCGSEAIFIACKSRWLLLWAMTQLHHFVIDVAAHKTADWP